MTATVNRNVYGTQEQNGLVDGQSYHAEHHAKSVGIVAWNDPQLAKITRLRLLSDPGYPRWDISYCHGVLKDGSPCEVELGVLDLPRTKGWKAFWRELYIAGSRDGVYVNRILNQAAISTLC